MSMSGDGDLSAVREPVAIFGIEKGREHDIQGSALHRTRRLTGQPAASRHIWNTWIDPNRTFINLNHEYDLRGIRNRCESFQDFDSIEALCGLETGRRLGEQLL